METRKENNMSKAYSRAKETCIRLKEMKLIAKGNGYKDLEKKYELMYAGAIIATKAIAEGPPSYIELKLDEDLGVNYLDQLNKRGYNA